MHRLKMLMSATAVALCLAACGGGSKNADQDIAEANKTIAAHLQANQVEAAASRLADIPRRLWDDETVALKAETDRRLEILMVAGRLEDLPAEVDENQLPRLQGISAETTRAPQDLAARIDMLEESVRFLEAVPADGLTPAQSRARQRLKNGIIQQQHRLLPAFRRSYAAGMDSLLWDDDIRVSAVGDNARTIRLVSHMFASNGNIRPLQEANSQMMSRLRFKRAEYRWHTSSDTLSFTLEAPADDQIGYWDGSTFKPVK